MPVPQPEALPDHALTDHYQAKDALARALMTSVWVAERARQAALDGLDHYLSNSTNLTPECVRQVLASVLERAGQEAAGINDDELLRQVKDVLVPMANARVQRKRSAAVRVYNDAVRSESKPAILKARQRRSLPLFGGEAVTSTVGVLLVGAPDLVDRAVKAVRAQAMAAEAAYRVVRCEDTESAATWVKEPEGAVRGVTLFAPWWDSAVTNITHFRALMASAEGQLGGPLDYLIVDDLGRRPKNLDGLKDVPRNYLSRAARCWKQVDTLARRKGGVLVAGFKVREGKEYDAREMTDLAARCRRYALSTEGGLLYATDGFGKDHIILEEPSDPCSATTSPGS